jgi:hypothetical protein
LYFFFWGGGGRVWGGGGWGGGGPAAAGGGGGLCVSSPHPASPLGLPLPTTATTTPAAFALSRGSPVINSHAKTQREQGPSIGSALAHARRSRFGNPIGYNSGMVLRLRITRFPSPPQTPHHDPTLHTSRSTHHAPHTTHHPQWLIKWPPQSKWMDPCPLFLPKVFRVKPETLSMGDKPSLPVRKSVRSPTRSERELIACCVWCRCKKKKCAPISCID